MTSLEEYEEAKKNAPKTRLIIDNLWKLTHSGTIKWYKSGHSGKYLFCCRYGDIKFWFWPKMFFSISLGRGWILGFEITGLCGRVHHCGELGCEVEDFSQLDMEVEKQNPSFFNDEKNTSNEETDKYKIIMELLLKAQ